jgi:hypothetical protein
MPLHRLAVALHIVFLKTTGRLLSRLCHVNEHRVRRTGYAEPVDRRLT